MNQLISDEYDFFKKVIITGGFLITTIHALGMLFNFYKKTNAESFVPEDRIRIIEIIDKHNHNITEDELSNYLEHHLDEKPADFTKKEFKHPIIVRFKYQNEIYSMCLKSMKYTRNEHKEIKPTPKYLSAIIRHGDDEICVTQRIREFHGHSKNFFDHIPDVENDLKKLLENHKGDLYTYDMMGNSNKIKL